MQVMETTHTASQKASSALALEGVAASLLAEAARHAAFPVGRARPGELAFLPLMAGAATTEEKKGRGCKKHGHKEAEERGRLHGLAV